MKKLLENLLKKVMHRRADAPEESDAREEQQTPKEQEEKPAGNVKAQPEQEAKKALAEEQEKKQPLGKPLFTAAGKPYWFEAQLKVLRIHPSEYIYKDCYGRRVLLIHERYPTFDSYDALYENRYFHNYYIETPEGFTHVRTADDQPDIPIKEGISVESFIREKKTWDSKLLKAAGLIPDEKK